MGFHKNHSKPQNLHHTTVTCDHISTLLLTFFISEMPQLILDGHLFLAVPPLYRLNISNKTFYAIDEGEKNKFD